MTGKRVFSELGQGNVFVSGSKVNDVYKTSDYSVFQFSKFNRNVLLRKEMLEQAKEGILSPVIVNENLMVIDGQHRLKASEQVGAPVEFIVKSGLNEHDIVRMNTVQKPWTLANFIEAFANQGKEEYVKLLNLLNDFYGNTTVVSQVAMNVTSIKPVREAIEKGEFEFFNYEKTVEFLTILKKFKEDVNVPYKTKTALALFNLFKVKKFSIEKLTKKVIQRGLDEQMRVKTFNITEQTKAFLDVYNHAVPIRSENYLHYHVTSNGEIIFDEEKADWAIVD